ncbi:MAG: PLD nuclease N-terminal domain-containing protein [Actinomycetota bacterium]|nr:PLD nuclease N-terminal domain-containing protein [Actinomycetota bacterium]
MNETERIVAVAIVLIPLAVIWMLAFFDIITRRSDLPIAWKGIWFAVVIFIPYIGIFIYAFVRPPVEGTRSGDNDPTATAQAIDEIHRLVSEHEDGAITNDQFAARKAAVFGLSSP